MPFNLGYARYVVSTAVITLKTTPAAGVVLPSNVKSVMIQNADTVNSISWVDEPTITPSATEGMLLGPLQTLVYDGDPSDLKFIRQGAADVSMRVGYFSG